MFYWVEGTGMIAMESFFVYFDGEEVGGGYSQECSSSQLLLYKSKIYEKNNDGWFMDVSISLFLFESKRRY